MARKGDKYRYLTEKSYRVSTYMDQPESLQSFEENVEMPPRFIFADVESLARCANQIIECQDLPFFDLLPDESARAIEVVVSARLKIQQHGGRVFERSENGWNGFFDKHRPKNKRDCA